MDCIINNVFKFWRNVNYNEDCNNAYNVRIPFVINDNIDDNIVHYIAACPHDTRTSFSGSGYPFVNYEQAFENTPNMGSIVVKDNTEYNINLIYPNSFYIHSHLVNPTLFIRYKKNNIYVLKAIVIGNHIPFRSLYHPSKRDQGATFYKNFNDHPVLSRSR